jgi:alanine racemase
MSSCDRPNVFEIDLGVVAANSRSIRARIDTGVRFFAVLKADAYGFGALEIARTVLDAGADSLALVCLQTAVALRQSGIACPSFCIQDRRSTRHMSKPPNSSG